MYNLKFSCEDSSDFLMELYTNKMCLHTMEFHYRSGMLNRKIWINQSSLGDDSIRCTSGNLFLEPTQINLSQQPTNPSGKKQLQLNL